MVKINGRITSNVIGEMMLKMGPEIMPRIIMNKDSGIPVCSNRICPITLMMMAPPRRIITGIIIIQPQYAREYQYNFNSYYVVIVA